MRLNLGCGSNKIEGYINMDTEESCKPDVIHDFTAKPLPFDSDCIEEILLFHTIEHISKKFHGLVLSEIWRVLKPDGTFIVSFPEFTRCYENWKRNFGDQKEYWEATMFGRQLYPSDYHVCIMDAHDFSILLNKIGFINVIARPEPHQHHNSYVTCQKGPELISCTDILKDDMEQIVLSIR